MRVLVFGANGIIGRSLVSEISDSFEVIAIDKRFSDLSDEVWKNCKTEIMDILLLSELKKIIRKNDIVINLAASSRISDCNDHIIESFNVNVFGAVNLMEACLENKAKQLIQASSLYATGSFGGFYSASKKAMESYLECFSANTSLNVVLLRLGSISGGLDDENSLPTKILRSILFKSKTKIDVNSRIVRDYLPVDGTTKYIKSIIGNNKFNGHEIEFVLNKPVTLSILIKDIKSITGEDPKKYLNISRIKESFSGQYLETPSKKFNFKKLKINIKGKSNTFKSFLKNLYYEER